MPAIKTPETQKAEENQYELQAGNGELILVVDDEEQIREMTGKALELHGYRVMTAKDGKEAIQLFSLHKDEIKVVLMDMMMPVMAGPASIQELCKINPGLKIITVSGLTDKEKLVRVEDAHINAFLKKPYTIKNLLDNLHDIIIVR